MTSNSGNGSMTTGEMLQANDVAAAAARVTAASPPPPPEPVIPTTSTEAAARLAEIKADPKFRAEYLNGSVRHAKEMKALQAVVDADKSSRVDMAIAGKLYDGIQPSGHLAKIGTAEMLRAVGADEGVIRQVLAGEPVSAEEHAAAAATKERLMKDHEFRARYLAGEGEAKRTMTLLNVITSSSVKSTAA